MDTNAKWCNRQVLWRFKEKLKTEVGGRKGRHKPAIQGRKPNREEKEYTAGGASVKWLQLAFWAQ